MYEKVAESLKQACQDLFSQEVVVNLVSPDPQYGDVASNVAMQLAKPLGRPPREIAQEIADSLQENPLFSAVGVAGPGFINMTLADTELLAALDAAIPRPLSDLKIVVEYSDPNPFKPLHAGHLYSTIVGDSIARLIESAGAKTIRLNYGGDVGLHVAKSMWAIITQLGGEYPEHLDDISDVDRPQWMGERYAEGHAAYEDSAQAKEEIIATNKRVYEIHSNNDHKSPFAQIYWTVRAWSYGYFTQLYEELHIKPFDRFIPESEVTLLGEKAVREQLKKGVFTESDGAIVFKGEDHGLHTRVFINSGGLPTYETKDVGLSLTKWQDYHFDESIIITASEQAPYMQVVVQAIRQFAAEPAEHTRHLTHGLLKMSGGVKMSSRLGNVLLAMDMLAAAHEAGKASGNAEDETVVLAALKYALLKNRLGGDVIYNPDESVAMEGNSGPYLQYAHARAKSILRKADSVKPKADAAQLDPAERQLTRKLVDFTQAYQQALDELAPHHICTYLYELSQAFNRFYEHTKVLGSEREAFRLYLVATYTDTLKNGLSLLGIHAPESM